MTVHHHPTGFGRGWVPATRDIGLPDDADGAAPPCPVLTPERLARFLDALSRHGNVRTAAQQVGVSRSALYLARRRDPHFAQGWRAALVLARDHAETVLAERALDGVEEPVFFRGELVAVRRRFDSRLLLAHLARLDRLCAEDAEAAEDAARFDALLGEVAHLPEAECHDEETGEPIVWPPRQEWLDATEAAAIEAGCFEDETAEALDRSAAEWDAHHHALYAAVDRLVEQVPPLEYKSRGRCGLPFWTVSTVSSGENSQMRTFHDCEIMAWGGHMARQSRGADRCPPVAGAQPEDGR